MNLLFLILTLAIADVDPGLDDGWQLVAHRGVLAGWPVSAVSDSSALARIGSTGSTAVLTRLVSDERLLQAADSLQIALFQQAPFRDLPAAALRDSVPMFSRTLERVVDLSRGHQSAKHFGLLWNSDTSDPNVCSALRDLVAVVRRVGGEGTRVYYVTRFVEADRCAHEVDFVLLDTDPGEDPEDRLRRWRSVHDTPVGLAGVGVWVDDDAEVGYRVRHSSEAQARYLENVLDRARSGALGRLQAVFVQRWRDIEAPTVSFRADVDRPFVRPFGLLRLDGTARPAYDVVRGLFTGSQRVFAFPAGTPTLMLSADWHRWLGWLVIGILALLSRLSLHFRQNMRRYFFAHGFYLETVGTGRQVAAGEHIALLVALSASAAVLGSILFDVFAPHTAFELILGRLPEQAQGAVVQLADAPWLLFIVLAGAAGLIMAGWGVMLTVLSRLRQRLTLGQRIALVVWPRWTMIPLMVFALVADTFDGALRTRAVGILGLLWLVSALWAVLRMVEDFSRAARTRRGPAYLLGVAIPLIVIAVLAGLLVRSSGVPVLEFAWHLATRR